MVLMIEPLALFILSRCTHCCCCCMQRPSPFPFHAPSQVSMTGSATLQCLAKPDIMVDVAVNIPKACLYEKDHLDCKYHGKRVLWLAVVGSQLKKHALFKQQDWTLFNGDARCDALPTALSYSAKFCAEARLQTVLENTCLAMAMCDQRMVT